MSHKAVGTCEIWQAFVLAARSGACAGVVGSLFVWRSAPPLMQMAMRTGVIEIKLIRLANAAKAAAVADL